MLLAVPKRARVRHTLGAVSDTFGRVATDLMTGSSAAFGLACPAM